VRSKRYPKSRHYRRVISALAATQAMSAVVVMIRFIGHSFLIRLAVLLAAGQRASGDGSNNLPTGRIERQASIDL
jgi:hypothetical protein